MWGLTAQNEPVSLSFIFCLKFVFSLFTFQSYFYLAGLQYSEVEWNCMGWNASSQVGLIKLQLPSSHHHHHQP